jgi:hypothetical protein
MSSTLPEVRVAIVGDGSIARSHASALQALPVVLDLGLRPVIAAVISECPMPCTPAVVSAAPSCGSEPSAPFATGGLGSLHGSYLNPARPISWHLRRATARGGACSTSD